jgi:outer membrane biosynthesis protein TonB
LDQSAAKAVRDSEPFPPLPDDYRENSLQVTIDFTIVRE